MNEKFRKNFWRKPQHTVDILVSQRRLSCAYKDNFMLRPPPTRLGPVDANDLRELEQAHAAKLAAAAAAAANAGAAASAPAGTSATARADAKQARLGLVRK